MKNRKSPTNEPEIIIGRELTLKRWLELIASPEASNVFPHNCFPSSEMHDEYIAQIDRFSEGQFKSHLRCFLIRSGSYGCDQSLRQSLLDNQYIQSHRLDEIPEFYRRLLFGATWEGTTWILDLLPGFPNQAIDVLQAYINVHAVFFTDHMLYGHSDAIDMIRARYKMLRMHTCFISYGDPDKLFASRLNEALQKRGVVTFFFPVNAKPGTQVHRVMREGVNHHDRVILICSKGSLDRLGVVNEINETLQREAREGRDCLIPIRLDNYIFSKWKPEDLGIAQTIKDRVVADFRGTKQNPQKFEKAISQLLEALKKKA